MILAALVSLIVLVATPMASPAPSIPDWCAVTLPNGVDPRNVEPPGVWFGQDGLYVGVPQDGILYALHEPGDDGGWNKTIWVRDKGHNELTIAVEPIGDHASPEPGVAKVDSSSIAGSIWFPEEGCYEITGTTTAGQLAVTVWVVFVDDWLATPSI